MPDVPLLNMSALVSASFYSMGLFDNCQALWASLLSQRRPHQARPGGTSSCQIGCSGRLSACNPCAPAASLHRWSRLSHLHPVPCTNCSCAPCSLSILWGQLERDWQRMGYFYEEGQARDRQSGVVRTNCIDCLDRTNVVQGVLGRKHLESVLRRLQLLQPGTGLPEAFPGVRPVLLICTVLRP